MGRYTGKTCRLSSMIVLTSSFFLVEIVVGYVTNSLALVGDAYHMLSDVIALFIGIASVRIAKWHSRKNTYGWARAEVLGALVNAVFLIALCFTILMEALQRLVTVDPIEEPDLLLVVGGIGLAINLIGLVLFGHHSHSHGGHSHLSNIDDDTGAAKKDDDSHSVNHQQCDNTNKSAEDQTNMESPQNSDNDSTVVNDVNVEIEQMTRRKMKSSAQLNMRGVFLHVMGDALGSVIVIISALVVKYVEADWKYRIDPAMSIVLVTIILSTSIPLLKESALILLQTVPTHIQVQDLQKKLINKVEGVIAVHEFHIWQLAGNRIIASAHIHCRNLRDYMRIAEEVKQFFHNEGIHSTTIQPEFVEFEELHPERDCALECGPDKKCFSDTCCNTKKKHHGQEKHSANKGDALKYRVCAIPCINECHPMQCCTDKKRRKAPAIFRSCCHHQNESSDDAYKEVMLCPDEDKPLITIPYSAVGNGICADIGHITTNMNTITTTCADNCHMNAKPLVLDVGNLTNPELDPADISDSPTEPLTTAACEEKYRPVFNAPMRMLRRPQSLYEVPDFSLCEYTPRRTLSSSALVTKSSSKSGTEEKLVLGDINERTNSPQPFCGSQDKDGATELRLLADYVTSDTKLNQAIISLKNDLKTIRGEMASKESVLNE